MYLVEGESMYNFVSPSKGILSFNDMVEDILCYIREKPNYEYDIMVGSDSQKSYCVKYVVSVIIHRKGKGGRYFYYIRKGSNKVSFQERIITETSYALEVATKLQESLIANRYNLNNITVHADVGKEGRSKEIIKTVTGMILASGFKAVIKPEGIAACSVADKHSKFQ